MKIVLAIIIAVFFSGCLSNSISNLNVNCEHGDCMVHYTLQGYGPASISLFLSFDNDHTWSKVVDDVSGDIGENVTPGEKVIVVHNMPIDGLANARFRIIVNNKETIETAVVGNIGEANATSENPHYNQPFEDDNAHYDQEEPTREAVEESSAITDDSSVEAPVVSNKQQSENRKSDTQLRKDNPTQQQISNNLNDAFNNNKGASETTTGTGQQGDPNGSINGRGVLGGGGNAGTGGGSGTYLGGGDGTGNGVGSGSGSGMSWNLPGRTMKTIPKVNGTAPDDGTVTVDIWVDANGNVTKAIANAAKSNTSNGTLFRMAEDAARKAKFSSSPAGNEQKGSIKITFKLN